MQYAITAVIDAELPYDLVPQIRATGVASFTVEVRELFDGTGRVTRVSVNYGGGQQRPQDRNNRRRLANDLIKQINIYGGRVVLHECYHEEGTPCITEEITVDDKRPPDYKRRGRRISRVNG